jgi:hypothetical protein
MREVKLHLYDLSQGMARAMSMSIIGKQLDGIWHSGIAVFGIEYFYGGGICAAPAGRAIPDLPFQEISLGQTNKSQVELENFLQSVNARFTRATYSLLRHNCNNFADEVSKFLLDGNGIPEHIIRLPMEFLTSPMGAALAPMIEGMEQRMRDQLIGQGRGLNPFGHVEGRSLLFPMPSLATDTVPAIVDSVQVAWLEEGDAALLKTAVEGIPESVIPADLKLRIASQDPSLSEQLVEIIKSQFKDKTPVLMSFNVLLRFYWKHKVFRDSFLRDGARETIHLLFQTSLASNNAHVVTASLSAAVNMAAAIDLNSFVFLQPTLELIIAAGKSQSLSAAQIKLFVQFLRNCLITLPVDETIISYNNALINECVSSVVKLKDNNDPLIMKPFAQALESRASKLLENGLSESFQTNVDPEQFVSAVEDLQALHSVTLHKTLMLIFK